MLSLSTPNTADVAAAMAAADRNAPPPATAETSGPGDDLVVRRWEAADTSRLNSAHWSRATGRPINEDLAGKLPNLRARCRYEAANNPIVSGIIKTYGLDWVGPDGPGLSIDSEDDQAAAWAAEAIDVWAEWFQRPTACGTIYGPNLLRQWIRSYFTDGEHLDQLVSVPGATPVQTRLKPLDPTLLRNPLDRHHRHIALGVERDDFGRPRTYHVADYQWIGEYRVGGFKTRPLPADVIVHDFLAEEPDQVRGVPWMATQLDPAAQIRDYDTEVLDAARNAANYAVVMWTNHTDAPFFLCNDTTEIQRNTMRFLPPGYQAEQLRPEQPHTNYVEYRRERMADLGRPVNMPLMLVRLTAERHNYSSARLDLQQYSRGLMAHQRWMGWTLERLFWVITTEASLTGAIGLKPQSPLKLMWRWPKMPHVDPVKEATAERMLLENGTLPYQDACAAHGQDAAIVIAKRTEDAAALEDAGLPPVPTPGSATGAMAAQEPDADDEDQADEGDQNQNDNPGARYAAAA